MKLKKIKSKLELLDSDKLDGYLIDADEKVARAIVVSLKDKKFKGVVGVLGRSGGFNRRVVESLKIDYLVSPELGDRKDSLKQRDSGLNHVVGKEMAKRGIVMVIDFDSLGETPLDSKHRTGQVKGKDKALRLARIMQNVKICRRAKCGVKIWGTPLDTKDRTGQGVDEKALRSFGFGVGMSSVEVSKCC